MPLPVTVEPLTLVPVAKAESNSPARRLFTSEQRVIIVVSPCLIQTPMPPWFVTVSRSSVMSAALSIATAWLAFASTLTPRTTMSWTPESMTPTLASGARS